MMMGGMAWMFFWMFFGTLLFIALMVAIIWLLVRAFRSQRMPMTPPPWPQPNPPPYQRGARPPVPGSEISEEGGRASPYPEQPSAAYPQPPPPQQEPRPRV